MRSNVDARRATAVGVAICCLVAALLIGVGPMLVSGAGDTAVSLESPETEPEPGDTVTYEVVVNDVDGGVGAHTTTVDVADPSVASITDVELFGDPGQDSVHLADDGSSVTVDAALMETEDSGSVVTMEVVVAVEAVGSTDLLLDVEALGDEVGNSYTVTAEHDGELTGTGPSFERSALDVSPTSGTDPLDVTVDATVENVGTTEGSTTATLVVDGEVVDTREVTLAADADERVTFETELDEPDQYEVTVDDLPGETVTVTEPLELEYSDLSVDPMEASENVSLSISATVENQGGAGTGTIPLVVDDETVATQTEELQDGEQTTVSFDHEIVEPGEYEVAVGNAPTEDVTVYETPTIDNLEADANIVGVDEELDLTVELVDDDMSATVDEYRWDLTGDGEIDRMTSAPEVTVTFPDDGERQVTVTVVDELGATAEATLEVVARDDPDATFHLDAEPQPDSDDAPDADAEVGGVVTVDATATADQPDVTLQWDTDLDATSLSDDDSMIELDATERGTYDLTLTVVDETTGVENETTETLLVADTTDPVANLAGPTEVVRGAEVTFDASGSTDEGTIVAYRWDLNGDGEVDVETDDPTITTSFGELADATPVSVTVEDAAGNADETTIQVTVNEAPSVTVIEPAPDERLDTATVALTYELTNTNLGDGTTVGYAVEDADGERVTEGTVPFEETESSQELTADLAALDVGHYTVTLELRDDTGDVIDYPTGTVERSFVVDPEAPTLTVTEPTESSVAYEDATLAVDVADAVSMSEDVTVEYRTNRSVDAFTEIETTPYIVDVADDSWPEGPTEVTLRATDETGNVAEETHVFEFISPPSIDNVTPADGSAVNSSTPTVVVTYSDDDVPGDSGVDPDATTLSVDGESVDLSGATVQNETHLEVPLPALVDEPVDDSSHTLAVTVADEVGATATTEWTLTVDTMAPRVDLTTATADDSLPHVGEENPLTVTAGAADERHATTMLRIVDTEGRVVSEHDLTGATGDGETADVTWDATDVDHNLVESGLYEVSVESEDAAGNVETVETTVDVDTDEPVVDVAEVDGINGENTVTTNETVTVTVEATDGRSVDSSVDTVEVGLSATFTNYETTASATQVDETTWEATIDTEALPDEGEFSVFAVATDRAGNVATETGAQTVAYDATPPRLSAVVERDGDDGTVVVTADEPLQSVPGIELERDGSTEQLSLTAVEGTDSRWSADFDAATAGSYVVTAIGTDLAGNVGTDQTSTSIEQVTDVEDNAVVLNEDTGTFIEFNMDGEVTNSFVTVSESDVSPVDLDASVHGVQFLTSQLGESLAENMTNATIHVPVDEDAIPADTDAADVTIRWYDEANSMWVDRETSVETTTPDDESAESDYWVTTVDTFSTYGVTVDDTTPPTLVDQQIGDGEIAWDDDEVTVEFEYADDLSGVDVSGIKVYVDDNDVTTASTTTITSAGTTHTLDVEPGTSHEVSVEVPDQAGNVAEFDAVVDVPDPNEPAIADRSVADGDVLDAEDGTVTTTFEFIHTGEIDEAASQFRVVDIAGDEVIKTPIDAATVSQTFEVEPGTSYEIEVTLQDAVGETTETLTFAVADESGEPAAGGGGGGPGDGPDEQEGIDADVTYLDDQVTIQLSDVSGGTSTTVDLEDTVTGEGVAVHELGLDTRISGPDFRIEIDRLTSEPASAPPVDGVDSIAYFEVRTFSLDDNTIDEVNFRFSVALGSIPGDATEDNVILYRHSDDEWSALETSHQGAGEFVATSPGFSTFAIAAEQPTDDPDSDGQTDDSDPDDQTDDSDPDDQTDDFEDDDTVAEVPGFTPAITLVTLLLSIIGLQTRRSD